MQKELTYILGAGASYQSIPVVKTFNRRLLKFIQYLREKVNAKSRDDKRRFNQAVITMNSLMQEFSAHQSFDTYFKKLFHFGDQKRINLGKRLLNLYFLWEHSKVSLNYDFDNSKDDFLKQSLFDKRYDALIAGLLKPIAEKSQPLCNVNFISWNYDINLINSIKNFFYPNLTYKNFINKIKKNQFLLEIDNVFRIINVNGSFYSSELDESSDLTNINIDQIIESKILSGYHNDFEMDEDADRIKFAWELNDKDEESLGSNLSSVIKKSENIVIIGYTFPLYNRFIDFGYLKQEDLINRNIVIQDPQSEVLKQNLIDIYKMNDAKIRVMAVSNCDSFYVPSSIFGISDFQSEFNVSYI